MGISLTPLASLCLGVIRGWIRVARRRRGGMIDDQGTPWTRLPAEQLRDQLAEEFQVEVSTRSVQMALKELEEANQVRREQHWKHRYKRDYWYALPDHHEDLERHSPRTIAGNYQSQRTRPTRQTEATPSTAQVLPTPVSKTQFSSEPPAKTPEEQAKRARKGRDTALARAIHACNARGQNNRPQGFGALTPYKGTLERTNEGKLMREVWVGGRCHQVADDPQTAPIK